MCAETTGVAGGAQEPVGSLLSAGSSANLEAPKSARACSVCQQLYMELYLFVKVSCD